MISIGLITIIAILSLTLGFLALSRRPKDKIDQSFFLMTLFSTLWMLSNYLENESFALFFRSFFLKLDFSLASFTAFFFLSFCLDFSEFHLKKRIKSLLMATTILFVILSFSDYLIRNVMIVDKAIVFKTGILFFLYALFIIGSMVFGCYVLINSYRKLAGLKKVQLLYILIGFSLTVFIVLFLNLILPQIVFISLSVSRIGIYSLIIFIFFTFYAITKYKFLNIKIILTQLLVLILLVASLFKLFLAKGWQAISIEGGFLVFLAIFGILLIRSVLREVHQREKLEILTKTLETANEKLKILDKTKSEFLSFASHQVKSPMSIVKGYATLIFDGTLGPVSNEIKDVAKKIKNSADRLISLVNNLLDLRKIEEGKMDFSFEEINIVKVVRDIAEELKTLTKDKNLELTFESSKDEIKIKLDIQKFSQVIQNLIDNAIKYTEKGWIKVSVDIISGKDVLIIVADSGRGISKELRSKMFEQFSRDSSVKKEIQGTGLGLYIAKQIVVAHQGQIWAESEGDNKGSKFMVKLPIANQRFDL